MPGPEPLKVVGLDAFRRDLKALGGDLSKELGKANKEAAELIASDSRRDAESQGGVAAKTAPSIKARGAAKEAKLAVGGSAYPFAMGAVFGSIEFKQFEAWRGNGEDAGYFIYPTIRTKRDEFIEVYGRLLDELADRAFPI